MDRNNITRLRPGFTLVELLVVIAIIGVLVALLLPAVQAAREAARRSQCISNLKQLGLAALNYESSNKHLPPGHRNVRTGSNLTSNGAWVTQMMPYMEEANLFSQIDPDEPFFEQSIDVGRGQFEKTHHVFLPSMTCPSDPAGTGAQLGLIDDHYGARGNYVANAGWADPGPGFEECGLWMNDISWQQYGNNRAGHPSCRNGVEYPNVSSGGRPVKSALAGYGPLMMNRGIKMSQATDGTSHTVLFAEVLKVPGRDIRGCMHWGGGAMYIHSEPPNSRFPDAARYCAVDANDSTAPCDDSVSSWLGAHKLAARSSHAGGVNVAMIDGSSHFVSDDVQSVQHGKDTPGVWQALSTHAGGELASVGGL